VLIRVLLVEHRTATLSATGINAFTGLIVEYVVTIAHSRQALDGVPRICIEYE
jgi:hypothetical protein